MPVHIRLDRVAARVAESKTGNASAAHTRKKYRKTNKQRPDPIFRTRGLNKIEPKELARISAKQLLAHWPEISSVTDAQGELFSNPSLTKTLVA